MRSFSATTSWSTINWRSLQKISQVLTLVVDATRSWQAVMQREREFKTLRRQLQRLKARNQNLEARMVAASDRLCFWGKVRNRAHIGIVVALTRNTGHGSCLSSAAWVNLMLSVSNQGCKKSEKQKGMSRHSIPRWEIAAATSILASARSFQAEHELAMCRASSGTNWSAALHESCGDATKSSAWKSQKVQALELQSYYVLGDVDPVAEILERCVWPDIQLVHDSTAAGCEAITLKQLCLAGCLAMDDEGHRESPLELHQLPQQPRTVPQLVRYR